MEKEIFQCFSYFVYKLREYFVETKRLLLLQQPPARYFPLKAGSFLRPLTVDGAASAAPYHRFLSFMARSISRLAARSAMA